MTGVSNRFRGSTAVLPNCPGYYFGTPALIGNWLEFPHGTQMYWSGTAGELKCPFGTVSVQNGHWYGTGIFTRARPGRQSQYKICFCWLPHQTFVQPESKNILVLRGILSFREGYSWSAFREEIISKPRVILWWPFLWGKFVNLRVILSFWDYFFLGVIRRKAPFNRTWP